MRNERAFFFARRRTRLSDGTHQRDLKADGNETNNVIRSRNGGWSRIRQVRARILMIRPTSFYVLEGTMSILIDDKWIDAPKGAFVLAPAGVIHDFENRSASRAGVLNFSIPGDFEKNMPEISKWFIENQANDN